jgi:hypothetical protein
MDRISATRCKQRNLAAPYTIFVMLGLVGPALPALLLAPYNLLAALSLWIGCAVITMGIAATLCD